MIKLKSIASVYIDDLLVVAFAFLILILAIQLAFALPTSEEINVCSTDAHRLCADAIPNPFKVLACFKEKRHLLSKPCAALLLQYGQ